MTVAGIQNSIAVLSVMGKVLQMGIVSSLHKAV